VVEYHYQGKNYQYPYHKGRNWSFNARYNTVATMLYTREDLCYSYLGFRVARSK